MNIRLFKNIAFINALIISASFLSSCESYLDKSPDAGITDTELFKNFKNFQGFVEGVQGLIASPFRNGQASQGTLADEGYMISWPTFIKTWDGGDYTRWQYDAGTQFGRNLGLNIDPSTWNDKGIWPVSWYSIYTANQGLANLDKLVDATDAQKRVIKGELLYLRAFSYFNIIQYWGGMPYVSSASTAAEDIKYLPRLSYQQTTDSIAKDFEEAAESLPTDWDDEDYGQLTKGKNAQRITKFMAYGMLGKALLYAGSPLMNYESQGRKEFNQDYCKRAAAALKKVIDLASSTGKKKLQDWSTINDVFFTAGSNKMPGGDESIITPSIQQTAVIRAYFQFQIGSPTKRAYGSQGHVSINYEYTKNFGMANGLPITESDSGYNPDDPWSNRDPRFQKWVLVDGDQMTKSALPEPKYNAIDQYIQLYTNGAHRGDKNGAIGLSQTGIDSKKYWDLTCNYVDNSNIDYNFNFDPPLLRLADVYLMYAEAVSWGYGAPNSVIIGDSSPMTAVEAVNKVRERCGCPDIDARFTSDQNKFFEEIVKERAVELFLEGQRFCDLRRWLRNGDSRYIRKTGVDFDRGANGKPINIKEFLITTRIVTDRNNWLPVPVNSATIYDGFKQNPGW